MPIFTKVDSFTKQIALFIKNGDYGSAYNLAKEMVQAFPQEMISHFLLAKSAFWMEKYPEAIEEGSRAMNIASQRQDMITCAVLVSNARFMLHEYEKGLTLLELFENDKDEDIERMLVIFSSAMDRQEYVDKYIRELMKINSKSAKELIERFLETATKKG